MTWTPHRVQYISDKFLGKCSEPVKMMWRAERIVTTATYLKQYMTVFIIAAYLTSLQSLNMAGAVPWAQLHERDAGGFDTSDMVEKTMWEEREQEV